MEAETKVDSKGAANRGPTKRYTLGEKLVAVRLHLQEGFPQALVSQETGLARAH